jgi:tetratricopeptide (TPR) repeat protein
MKWALSMGEKYLTECDYTQAVTMFSRAIRVDARSEPAYLGRAEAYIQLNQPAAAVEDLTFVIDELTTDDADVYIQRAEAYTMQGNTDAAQADLDTAASLGADTTAAEENLAALTPEPTPEPESTAAPEEKKIEHPREFRFTASYKSSSSDGDFFYDEDGRLTHITLDGFDIYIDYTDGKASAAFDEAQVNAMDDPHYILEIHEMTLKADGTIDTLYAYLPDVFAYIEFNEDGLPSYFTIAQDDLGHLITYTRTEDGRLTMDSVQYVYGYMDNHVADPVEDYHTVSGEVIY